MKRKPNFSSMGGDAETERLLTTGEAAELLAVSPDTLKDWRCRWHRRGPEYIRVGGSRIRYSLQALRRYVRSRTVRTVRRQDGKDN
jgi:hypothetical protein